MPHVSDEPSASSSHPVSAPSRVFDNLNFLGHMVAPGYMYPNEKNVDNLRNALRPQTKKDIRSFVSLHGFYQKYI